MWWLFDHRDVVYLRAQDIGGFYREHERVVLAYFLRRSSSAEVAADLAAETFAEVVWQARHGVELRDPRAWLFSIAHGKLVDFIRRGQVERRARRRIGLDRLEWTDTELAAVTEAASTVSTGALAQALRALPREQAIAVVGRVVHEQAYAELAHQQQVSEALVRQRVRRGLSRLRRMLNQEVT